MKILALIVFAVVGLVLLCKGLAWSIPMGMAIWRESKDFLNLFVIIFIILVNLLIGVIIILSFIFAGIQGLLIGIGVSGILIFGTRKLME